MSFFCRCIVSLWELAGILCHRGSVTSCQISSEVNALFTQAWQMALPAELRTVLNTIHPNSLHVFSPTQACLSGWHTLQANLSSVPKSNCIQCTVYIFLFYVLLYYKVYISHHSALLTTHSFKSVLGHVHVHTYWNLALLQLGGLCLNLDAGFWVFLTGRTGALTWSWLPSCCAMTASNCAFI